MLFKSYKPNKTIISFELFPPRTDQGIKTLKARLPHLVNLNPSFITVTYGAMGSTQTNTLEIASYIKKTLDIDVAHHTERVVFFRVCLIKVFGGAWRHRVDSD